MVNLDASTPPFNDQVTVSLAEKVATVVRFSFTLATLVASPALPDGPVIFAAVVSLEFPASPIKPGSRTLPKVVSASYFPLSLT